MKNPSTIQPSLSYRILYYVNFIKTANNHPAPAFKSVVLSIGLLQKTKILIKMGRISKKYL